MPLFVASLSALFTVHQSMFTYKCVYIVARRLFVYSERLPSDESLLATATPKTTNLAIFFSHLLCLQLSKPSRTIWNTAITLKQNFKKYIAVEFRFLRKTQNLAVSPALLFCRERQGNLQLKIYNARAQLLFCSLADFLSQNCRFFVGVKSG